MSGPRVVTRSRSALSAAWGWVASGALALLSTLGLCLVDPLDQILSWQTTLQPGTLAYTFWDQPLDVLYIRTFIFNITNAEAFLSGEEKMNLQEIGPFVYREVTVFANLTVHDNDTASFSANRTLEFLPHLSVGDPKDYVVTVPNLPLLGAAAMLGESALVTNLALRSLALFVGATPLLTMTADKVLWGYDDPLVSMAHSVAPSFVDFKRLGLLDRMYTEVDDVVVRAGRNGGVDPKAKVAEDVYSIQTYRGATGFPHWGHGVQPRFDPLTGEALPAHLSCDTVQGSYEGVLFPRNVRPEQRMYVYRKQFCRSAPIVYQNDGFTEEGYRYMLYHVDMNPLIDPDDPESQCYCTRTFGSNSGCVPPGFSSIAPCFYKMPVALSQPHLMDAQPALQNKLTGLNPNRDEHLSYFRLQPETGIPLNIRCRLQINLMMGHTRLSITQPFDHMALPIMWVDMTMDLPDNYKRLVHLAVIVGPAAQTALLVLSALAGAAMVAWGLVLRRRLHASGDRRLSERARSPLAPSLHLTQRLTQHMDSVH
ncbi:hypothetical protein R5R35_007896 [Gryllus longicercus]|uniref:Scavenger receptor class B member 1 n=1 Tax=Gryllus longicercus TaxID=2509291 RepID=A0AAN9V3J9_9ORTH